MKAWVSRVTVECAVSRTWPAAPEPPRLSCLHLVGQHELEDLRRTIALGRLPLDLEAKLSGLAEGDLVQRAVAQQARCFADLLLATQEGLFTLATRAERERLLCVLAYVRKDEDAIPDYKPRGFTDDLAEIRAAGGELAALLEKFKAWRLRHQVPEMWSRQPPPPGVAWFAG